MKKIIIIIILVSTAFAGKSQNLVLNPGFEQIINCPNSISQFAGFVSDWTTPTGGTPDYFNTCAGTSVVGVPGNSRGWQYPHSGNAYCGIVVVRISSNLDFREYIEAPLSAPLVANNCYHFEMYMSVADQSQCTTDDIQVHFSNTFISGVPGDQTLQLTPHITNTTGNYPDTMNWILMSGNYTAAGGENFIIIGNFILASSTNVIVLNNNNQNFGMIYIDDVSLSPCTGIEEQNEQGEIKIYPNPAKDYLTVHTKEKAGISITDILGKQVLNSTISPDASGQSTINVQSLKGGIYFIEINDAKNISRKKFLKE